MTQQVHFKKGLYQNVANLTGEDSINIARNLSTNPIGTAASTDTFGSIFLGNSMIGSRYLAMLETGGMYFVSGTSSNTESITNTNSVKGLIYSKGSGNPIKIADSGTANYILRYNSTVGRPIWDQERYVRQYPTTGTTRYALLFRYNQSDVSSTSYTVNYVRFVHPWNTAGSRSCITADGTIYIDKLYVEGLGSGVTGGIHGLLSRSSTESSASIYTYANQPLTTDTYQTNDEKPVTAKNVVEYVEQTVEDVMTDVAADYLPVSGGTMNGDINMNNCEINMMGNSIYNLRDPVDPQDAVNLRSLQSFSTLPTISGQDVPHNQLDGTKDFNIATVLVSTGQQSTNYYLGFTTKMQSGTICHIMIHSSIQDELPPAINYYSNQVTVKIPSNIRVWDDSSAVSGNYEGVWINGEMVMYDDVSNNQLYSNKGKKFTIPASGFVELSVMYVSEEVQYKKGGDTVTVLVNRTLIKVDSPVSTYNDGTSS